MVLIRTRPVIAVFGSTYPDSLDLAEELGVEIASKAASC
jgi:hypothetical protein